MIYNSGKQKRLQRDAEWWHRRVNWHRWFAWYPVELGPNGLEKAWLEFVECKRNPYIHHWEYRKIPNKGIR